MFAWLRKIFRTKTASTGISEDEVQKLKQIMTLLRENPHASDVMEMLGKDFEARIVKRDKGGSSSSPISSP